jgi:phosphoinositide-3-kinase regulatory subunit 4
MWVFMRLWNRDEAQFGKLQQLGMTSSDETKLMAMREYIFKLANATSR